MKFLLILLFIHAPTGRYQEQVVVFPDLPSCEAAMDEMKRLVPRDPNLDLAMACVQVIPSTAEDS